MGCGSAKLERVEFSLTQSRLSIARINSALHSLLFRFGSAFLLRFTTQANKFERALHHPCTCKRNTANTGKTASTPTLSSPITLQLPSHRSTVARRPSPSNCLTSISRRPPPVTLFSLFFTTIYNTRSLTYSPPFVPRGGHDTLRGYCDTPNGRGRPLCLPEQ